jgi:hypothetical protein
MSFFSLTIKLSFSTLARVGFRTRGKNTSTPDALLGVWTERQKEIQTRMEERGWLGERQGRGALRQGTERQTRTSRKNLFALREKDMIHIVLLIHVFKVS